PPRAHGKPARLSGWGAGGFGTARGTAVAEPPPRAHSEPVRLPGVGELGQTGVCAPGSTDGVAGDAGGRWVDPGDGAPERLSGRAPADVAAGEAGNPRGGAPGGT
ncbi:unnamed protein product, partial [Laminaria digitata]